MTDIELSYIAGFVDGEGCITLSRKKDSTMKKGYCYRPHISVSNTNKEVIYWLRNITKVGNVSVRKPYYSIHKTAYSWQVWSRQAYFLTEKILPFLKIKFEQAKILIEFSSYPKTLGIRGLTDDAHLFQEQSYNKMRLLNQKGGKQ